MISLVLFLFLPILVLGDSSFYEGDFFIGGQEAAEEGAGGGLGEEEPEEEEIIEEKPTLIEKIIEGIVAIPQTISEIIPGKEIIEDIKEKSPVNIWFWLIILAAIILFVGSKK